MGRPVEAKRESGSQKRRRRTRDLAYSIAMCMVTLILAVSASRGARDPARAQSSATTSLNVARLACFRRVEQVGTLSDFDRKDKNDDRLPGKSWYLCREGDAVVTAETLGAGAITPIFAAPPLDDKPDPDRFR
jgi:hypothetical protein